MTAPTDALAVRRVTRLGVAGVVWAAVLRVLLVAGVAWVLVASSADPDSELLRNGSAVAIASLPGVACLAASIAALVIARRRAAAGRPRPGLLPKLVLALLTLVTLATLALGAVAAAIAALTLTA